MAKRASIDLQITVSRDSVCQGDDANAPHQRLLELPANATLADLCSDLLDAGYLAQISGGEATWVLRGARDELAVLAQQWKRPLYLKSPDLPLKKLCAKNGKCDMYVVYHQQKNPLEIAQRAGGDNQQAAK